MKRLSTILILFFISFGAMAQLEVKPDSFKEVVGFVNINMEKYSDDNDQPFAVIKIRTENITDKQRRELHFEGNAATFIVLEYKIGEVWVYLTARYADYLKISHPDMSSTEFTLPEDLKPKCGYELTLVNNSKIVNEENEELRERVRQLEEAQKKQDEQWEIKESEVETTRNRTPKYTFFTLNLSNNTYNRAAFGFTLGTMRKVGVFVTVMTNFVFSDLGEENKWEHINSDKMQALLDDNPTYTFERKYVSMSVIGGLIFKVYGPINMKIGGGYGNNSLWVNVYNTSNIRTDYWISDYSAYGFGGLTGIQAHFGRFVVSLDGATTNFKIFETRLGLGIGIGGK